MPTPTDAIEPDGRCDDPHAVHRTPFKLGDLVVDKEDCREDDDTWQVTDDASPAIVVREGRVRANDVYLDGDTTVADVDSNADYPRTDPVVTIVFVGALDRHVANWRGRWEPYQIDWRNLDEFRHEWGIPIKTYDYPASRLEDAVAAGLDPDAILAPAGERGGDDE